MMRPRVACPPAPRIGAPVFVRDQAALEASEEPSAMVRTMPSPSCCCTSSVRAVPSIFSAS